MSETDDKADTIDLRALPLSRDNPAPLKDLDQDAIKLAELGYAQDLKRNFSAFSVLGVGFSLTNSWFGISAALVTGISSGGPVLIIYGIILVSLISICVGISLSELASSYPSSGGQYYWTSSLAPPKHARLLSYLTGFLAWAGAVFTSASVALACGSALVGCWQLSHPEFTIVPWHVFVAYQAVNVFAFVFNCYGRSLPTVSTVSLWMSLISFFIILVAVPSKAPTHQHAKFVFANFVNNTGWSSNAIAFIVGLINPNYSMACLDAATHLAEEVHQPERMVPVAILGTVAIGFVTSWFFSVSITFSVQDLDGLFQTTTGVPILELFYQALGNKAGAIVLETLIIATGIGCLIASHTWQSRLAWSFSRDNGMPFSIVLSRVHKSLNVPINAHFMSCCVVAMLGCLYLGSYTAFNSIVTACIVLLYISYSIPVTCLLIKGRNNIPRGPFWCGRVGHFANYVLLLWTFFALVMYSLPPVYPAQAGNMNYVSAVYGVIALIVATDWFVRARYHYRGQDVRAEDISAIVHQAEQQKVLQ